MKIFKYEPIGKKFAFPETFGEQYYHYLFTFDNGYMASVISHPYSFGGEEGLWELAVLDEDGKITYDTPITNDVVGWLTVEEVNEILDKIKEL